MLALHLIVAPSDTTMDVPFLALVYPGDPMKLTSVSLTPIVLTFVLIIGAQACLGPAQEKDQEELTRIVGTWREYLLVNDGREETALRRIALDDQGQLFQVLQYEFGSQCRIWTDIGTISLENGILDIGGEFQGPINEDGNSINLQYRSFKGADYQFVLERVKDMQTLQFMDSLEACLDTPYEYAPPIVTDDGLSCSSLVRAGIDTALINTAMKRIGKGDFGDLHSLLIVFRDSLVLEEYFGAKGRMKGPYVRNIFRDRIHALASCTKSVNSLLFGIARDQGWSDSLATPVATYFPEFAREFDEKKKLIEMKHLLMMSAGLEWNELSIRYETPDNDVNRMWTSSVPLTYLFQKPVVAKAGEEFNYNSGASDALGEILRRVTKLPADRFAEQHLFEPLGISAFSWTTHRSGMVATSGGLSLRARDLAKLGLLMLHKGEWNGRRVVSTDWIKESVWPHIKTGSGHYGYQWWMRTERVQGTNVHSYYAIGYGGNFLSVFPELDLIVVSTAQDFERGWSERHYSMLKNYLLPAIMAGTKGSP